MPAFSLALLLLVAGSVCLSVSLAVPLSQGSAGLYADVQRVNRSESLAKVRALPIVHFRFLLDSVPDRVQLGVLGAEAQRLFPESIDVLPSAPFAPPRHTHTSNNNGNSKARSTISITSSSSNGGSAKTGTNNNGNTHSSSGTTNNKSNNNNSNNNSNSNSNNSNNSNNSGAVRPSAPVVVTNFPVVDKSVLFMHGLVALQELLHMYEALAAEVALLGDKDAQLRSESEHLLRRLQQEAHAQTRERLALAEQARTHAERERAAEEERALRERERVTLSLEEEKALLQYEESLARARLEQQEKASQSTLAHQWERERALAEKRESTQRAHTVALQSARQTQSAALEAQRLSFEKEKIRAEIEARAQQDKLNEERAMRKLQAQSQLDTQRMVQGIQSVSLQLSALLKDVLSRPRQLLVLAGIAVALIASFFLVRELSSLVRQWVQARIGKPSLVRETSFHWSLLPTEDLWEALSSLWRSSSTAASTTASAEDARLSSHWQRLEDEFRDVILSREDKQRVLQLALATRNTRRSGAPYRHVLLHGPPGTGKTLIARRLAQSSGMDYAVLSGGDVAPLGEDAVSQLHALFRWANRSRRGLLVFIDEAEAFLASRSQTSSGEGGVGAGNETHLRNSLNALLYQTGTPSRKFMMILATNRPEDLDSAVLDRIDVSIQVSLPQEEQRQQLIKLYMHLHLVLPAKKSETRTSVAGRLLLPKPRDVKRVDEECLQEKHVVTMAKMTEGFSGREISKLFISAQYAMFLAEKQILTWPILKRTVDVKIGEHRIKSSGFQTGTITGDDDSREDQEMRWKRTDKTGNAHKK